MDSALIIRPFSTDDAGPLTALLHEAYAELGAMGLNYTAVDQAPSVTEARALAGQCWVAENGGTIVASLTMSLPPSAGLQALTPAGRASGCAWLNQVAVSPSIRGVGVAAKLWRLGRRWAASHGARTIGVDTAVPAVHLVDIYTSWGFEVVDTIHWPGKTYDSVVMTRRSPPADLDRIEQ